MSEVFVCEPPVEDRRKYDILQLTRTEFVALRELLAGTEGGGPLQGIYDVMESVE